MKITIESKNKEYKNPLFVLDAALCLVKEQVRAPLKSCGEFITIDDPEFTITIQQDDYEECSNCNQSTSVAYENIEGPNRCLKFGHIIKDLKKESCTSHEKG